MTVCSFFLQGRCRHGERCWNEHPKGGRGGDYRGNQQPSRGGFGNRVWINPSQRSGGEYIQPSSFSGGGNNDRSRAGGASRDVKSSDFSFSGQNRFSALASHSGFDRGGQSSADDNAKHLDTIQSDMEVWQTCGQWPFSCYSVVNGQISGFVELSPEELRLEYYSGRAAGDTKPYESSVQQLISQWRNRVQELRTMSRSTQISLISELNKSPSQTSSPGFGSTASGFGNSSSSAASSSTASGFRGAGFGSGSQSSSSFSFAWSKTGFGASTTQQAPGFGGSAFAQPSSGFGAPSAASFSFAAPAVENKPSAGGFGSASGFSFKTSSGGLGTGFGSAAPVESVSGGAADASQSGNSLFTAHSELTAEELKEFTAKRFTLGQIPLKPPPADLLML